MARCEWNPGTQRGATDPASEGDCPNDAKVSLGATARWHLCETCASLPPFANHKPKPILTIEQEVQRRVALSFEDALREDIEVAREAIAPCGGLASAQAKVLFDILRRLVDDPRAKNALLRAFRNLAEADPGRPRRGRRRSRLTLTKETLRTFTAGDGPDEIVSIAGAPLVICSSRRTPVGRSS